MTYINPKWLIKASETLVSYLRTSIEDGSISFNEDVAPAIHGAIEEVEAAIDDITDTQGCRTPQDGQTE